jgi:hypothetical protein
VFTYLFWILAFVAAVVAWLVWALARPGLFARRVARSLKEFARNRQRLEHEFITAAAATGKPRGLSWKECGFQPELVLARDRANGEFVGLVVVTMLFESIEVV